MGWLEYILVTPSHHRVHHAINLEYIDKNYSQIFIFWDKIFGTFQQELKNKKPVYGTTRPVQTWNPIIINFKHLWQLMQDAWHAERFFDKLIIWFMPNGWRPVGVAEKYPITVLYNPKGQIKYHTNNSQVLIWWTWVQLLLTVVMIFHLFNIMPYLSTPMVYLYSGFLIIQVFTYTSILDGRLYALIGEYVKIGLGLCILIYLDFIWFGLSGIFAICFILYLFISLVLTHYFLNQKSFS
jgi:hypothetical protein